MKRQKPARLYEQYLRRFLPIVLALVVAIGGILIFFQSRSLFKERRVTESNRNRETIDEVCDYVEGLQLLATYPYMDSEVLKILRKDYSGENTMFERVQDDAAVKNKLAVNLYHLRTDLNSVILISSKTGRIYSAVHGSLMANADYQSTDWYQAILGGDRSTVCLGLYHNELTPYYDTLFGIGNAIVDPQTKQILGVVIINVEERYFRRNWEIPNDTEGSCVVLYDSYGHRYDSRDALDDAWLQRVTACLGEEPSASGYIWDGGTPYCVIRAVATDMGWTSVRIVNMSNEWRQVAFFVVLLLLGSLSVYLVLRRFCRSMALRVTQPLAELSEAMRQTAEGDFDVRTREGTDEVGTLARQFNDMSDHIRRLIDRVRSEEREKSNAELLALQSQINPHFLYNTIHTIKTMAELQGAARIANVLDQLTLFLRSSYGLVDELVTVQRECAQVKSYLELMSYRYMGRFHYRFDIASSVEKCFVPRFILQPFVENAIIHGIDLNGTAGEIVVSGRREGDCVLLIVRDNGRGMSESAIDALLSSETVARKSALNVGVGNVIRRIHLLCGERYGLSVESEEGDHTSMRLTLPAITESPAEN